MPKYQPLHDVLETLTGRLMSGELSFLVVIAASAKPS